jgi:hypothetical protein
MISGRSPSARGAMIGRARSMGSCRVSRSAETMAWSRARRASGAGKTMRRSARWMSVRRSLSPAALAWTRRPSGSSIMTPLRSRVSICSRTRLTRSCCAVSTLHREGHQGSWSGRRGSGEYAIKAERLRRPSRGSDLAKELAVARGYSGYGGGPRCAHAVVARDLFRARHLYGDGDAVKHAAGCGVQGCNRLGHRSDCGRGIRAQALAERQRISDMELAVFRRQQRVLHHPRDLAFVDLKSGIIVMGRVLAGFAMSWICILVFDVSASAGGRGETALSSAQEVQRRYRGWFLWQCWDEAQRVVIEIGSARYEAAAR